jgi:threonine synthase
MVLFPSDGVSPVQKAQMVTAPFSRLKVLGVQSDFDYCQSSLKQVFNDNAFTVKLKVTREKRLCYQ